MVRRTRISRDSAGPVESDFIVVEQAAFTGGDAAYFDLALEPFVMVHRTRQ